MFLYIITIWFVSILLNFTVLALPYETVMKESKKNDIPIERYLLLYFIIGIVLGPILTSITLVELLYNYWQDRKTNEEQD